MVSTEESYIKVTNKYVATGDDCGSYESVYVINAIS